MKNHFKQSILTCLKGLLIVSFIFLGLVTPAQASERIEFQKGSNSGSVTGSVTGYDVSTYRFGVKEGQIINIHLTSNNRFLYFSLIEPSTGNPLEATPKPDTVTEWSGAPPRTGDYEIKVYLMRNEARRGKSASFTLKLDIQ